MKNCFKKIIGVALIVTFISAHADQAQEKQDMENIVQNLYLTINLVNKAEADQVPDGRLQFQYAWLRQDLNNMLTGVQQYLNPPIPQPVAIPAITGDYLIMRGAVNNAG